MNCNQSTISELWNRYQQQGHARDRPRSGRLHWRDDSTSRPIHTSYTCTPAADNARHTVGTHNRPINGNTVRRRLVDVGLKSKRPYIGQVLLRRHKQARLAWANTHTRWPRQSWENVLFTDESKFNLSYSDGRRRVFRRNGERFAQCCVVEVNRFGGSGLMVWAGISRNSKRTCILCRLNAMTYRDTILQPTVVPSIRNNGLTLLQQDNARPHTARITTDSLRQQAVNVMPWPSVSPEFNPIEHLWNELGRRVRDHPVQPQNLQQIEVALNQEWARIPQNVVRRYVHSMRSRCDAVIAAVGGHTRY